MSRRMKNLGLVSVALWLSGGVQASPVYQVERDEERPTFVVRLADGPVQADDPTVRVAVNTTGFAELFADLAETKRLSEHEDFYRERRGFQDPTLTVVINTYQGDTVMHPIALDGSESIEQEIAVPRAIEYVSFRVQGNSEIYKCFDEQTCVFERHTTIGPRVRYDAVPAVVKWRNLLSCGDGQAIVASYLADPTQQRVTINEYAALNHTGAFPITAGRGDAAATASEFAGFTAPLRFYESRRYQADGYYQTAYVFRESGGLKVKVDTEPHYFCHYSRTVTYPDTWRQAVRLGQRCPYNGSRASVTGSSPGVDHPYSHDWFFPACHNL